METAGASKYLESGFGNVEKEVDRGRNNRTFLKREEAAGETAQKGSEAYR
jgi:hypothetical protein